MLPPEQLELITAAVDGELSATETRAFRRLLEASPEARALFANLKDDSERVRTLPRATPPADLRTKILARIASTAPAPVVIPTASPAPAKPGPQPAPASAPQLVVYPVTPVGRRARRNIPAWVPVAAAASVLLCVTAASFAYFNHLSNSSAGAPNSWANDLPAAQNAPQSVPSPTATHTGRPDPDVLVKIDVSPVPPLPLPRPVVPEAIVVVPEPRAVTPPDLIGGQILPPLPPFDVVRVRVPFLRTVAELDRDDTRQELTDELTRDPVLPPFRFDLFVRDTARGAEVFQNAAKATGLTVFADALTVERLKKKQIGSVVIYTESLTATELTALFVKLCAEDTKFSPRVCDSLHATPVVRADELEMKQILGVDVGLFKRPTGSGGTGAVPGGERDKPVSAGTIDSVAATLTSPGAKLPDKSAVLLTWQTAHPMLGRTPPALSAELQQYLKKRGPRKPDVVPTVIVIRLVG